jgi:hypothetical protein
VGAVQIESFHSNTNREPSAFTLGHDPRYISDQSFSAAPKTAEAHAASTATSFFDFFIVLTFSVVQERNTP